MVKQYIMGVNIGTTSTKAVLFAENGEQIERHAAHYPLYTDVHGKAEQDPNEIFTAMIKAISSVMVTSMIDPESLKAISFSAAMHSLILIDEQNQPLTKCITWADERSNVVLERMKREFSLQEIYEKTGTPIHQMSPFAKICWLNEVQPELIDRTSKFVGIKSYLLYRLFDKWLIDEALASASGLYCLSEHDWNEQALQMANVPRSKLPQVVPETHNLVGLSTEWRDMLGISDETIFIIGSSDGALANLGIQATGEHDVTVTVGTSGAVRKVISNYHTDPSGRTFCYGITAGAVNNGGKAIEWALAEFGSEREITNQDYDHFICSAEKISPGAQGLIFQPYLLGERAPLWTSRIRGAFVGITINHTKAHFIRTVLEGVALNLATVYEAVQSEEDILYVSGNLGNHPFWCQLLADVFNREVRVPYTVEGSSLGAAILAMNALNMIADFALPEKPKVTAKYFPCSKRATAYMELRKIYEATTARLIASYGELMDWSTKFDF